MKTAARVHRDFEESCEGGGLEGNASWCKRMVELKQGVDLKARRKRKDYRRFEILEEFTGAAGGY